MDLNMDLDSIIASSYGSPRGGFRGGRRGGGGGGGGVGGYAPRGDRDRPGGPGGGGGYGYSPMDLDGDSPGASGRGNANAGGGGPMRYQNTYFQSAQGGQNGGASSSNGSGNGQQQQQQQQQFARISVTNLDFGVTETDLRELFARVGRVGRIQLFYDRNGQSQGTAHVTYHQRADAISAIQQYNGVTLDGRPMKLDLMVSAGTLEHELATRSQQPQGSGAPWIGGRLGPGRGGGYGGYGYNAGRRRGGYGVPGTGGYGGRGGYGGGGRGGYSNNNNNYYGGGGRGSGGFRRGGGRGGAFRQPKEQKSQVELDDDLDAYMAARRAEEASKHDG